MHNKHLKSVSLLLAVVLLLSLGTSTIFAQGPDEERPLRGIVGYTVLLNTMRDMSEQPLRDLIDTEALPEGYTAADIAANAGLEVDAIVAQATATITEAINTRVEAGKLTQERANETLATLAEDLTTAMYRPVPQRQPQRDNLQHRFDDVLVMQLVEATGMSPEELLTQARENSLRSIAEVASANGIDPETLVAASIAAATEGINEALANENITQEQADTLLERLVEFYANAINAPLQRFTNEAGNNEPVDSIRRALLAQTMEVNGLDARDLIAQLDAGSSIADILAENGINAEDVVAGVLANLNAQLEESLWTMVNHVRD